VQPWYDGCTSWVELHESLDPSGAVPVISDADFARREANVRALLGATVAA